MRPSELRPHSATAVNFGPRQQSSVFLAQLLAAASRHQGVELDETASSLALYARAAGAASSAHAAVDLTI